MTSEVSYSEARQHLAELWDRAVQHREVIRLTRRGSGAVVLVAADEYEGLLETAHLLRSPSSSNACRNAVSSRAAFAGEPATLADLREDLSSAEEA